MKRGRDMKLTKRWFCYLHYGISFAFATFDFQVIATNSLI